MASSHLPPPFTGRTDVNAADWLSEVRRYAAFKDHNDDRHLQLLKYLLRGSAADWLEAQPAEVVDTLPHFLAAFQGRYDPNELTKYRSAQELFQRRQRIDESSEDFIAAIKKIGRRIEADDQLLRYAAINGLRAEISAHVIRQQPETLAEVIAAARIAEITTPPSTTSGLGKIEEELRRLSAKLDRTSTAAVSPRASPTPFGRPITPPVHQQSFQYRSDDRSNLPPARRPTGPPQQSRYQPRRQTQRVSFAPEPASDLQQPQIRSNSAEIWPCPSCGYNYHNYPNYCPALDPRNKCTYCMKPNHFSRVCRALKRDQQQQQRQY